VHSWEIPKSKFLSSAGHRSPPSNLKWPPPGRQSGLRTRLHWSQNRHNTANQHLSAHTPQRRVATFNPTCVPRLLATQVIFVFSLRTVRDVKGTRCTGWMMTGTNICWQILNFVWSMRKYVDGGCISFENREVMENILNCARHWENFPISSKNIPRWI